MEAWNLQAQQNFDQHATPTIMMHKPRDVTHQVKMEKRNACTELQHERQNACSQDLFHQKSKAERHSLTPWHGHPCGARTTAPAVSTCKAACQMRPWPTSEDGAADSEEPTSRVLTMSQCIGSPTLDPQSKSNVRKGRPVLWHNVQTTCTIHGRPRSTAAALGPAGRCRAPPGHNQRKVCRIVDRPSNQHATT